MATLDPTTEAAIEEALELLKAGKKAEAQKIVLPLTLQHPNIPDGWYLLGFTVTELEQKRYCFQQVLKIDPTNQAAQRQLAKVLQHIANAQAQPLEKEEQVHQPEEQQETARAGNTGRIVLAFLGVVVLLMLCGVGFYMVYGFNTNRQVNTLFQQHQCAEVMQVGSGLPMFFPRDMFSSTFDAYQKLDECQARLTLTNAANTQDWAAAYNDAKAYLAKYPQGAFTQEVSEQTGSILLAWSKSLSSQKDYKAAIEKLTLLQHDFPTSSATSAALKTMLDDYLLWGQSFFEQRDFENAEKNFQTVALDSKASLEQSKQANEALAQLYLAWGQAQVDGKQYDKGLEYYNKAQALNPTLADYTEINIQISLKQADAALENNDFNQALTLVHDLPGQKLTEQNKTDAQALQGKILIAYGQSDSAQAQEQMGNAATGLCQEQLPTLPIFGTNPDVMRFVVQPAFHFELPSDLQAKTPAEFHYAICVTQTEVTIETCEYQRGYLAQRNYYVWEISVYELATGKPLQKTVLQGSQPRSCGDTEAFQDGVKTTGIYGDPPKAEEIAAWLQSLNIAK